MQTNVLQDKYKQTYPNQTPGKHQPSFIGNLDIFDQGHYNIVDLIILNVFHITGSKTI